jgi:manganese transport protein
MELLIGTLVGVIGLCYLAEWFVLSIAWGEAARGAIIPQMPDLAALTISVGIIGATVMPNAI